MVMDHHRLCSLYDNWFSEGKWTHSQVVRECVSKDLYQASAKIYGYSVYAQRISTGVKMCGNSTQQYSWKPNGCRLRSVDPVNFARLLAGRRVLIVGDSTSMLMYVALACELSSEIDAEASEPARAALWASGVLHVLGRAPGAPGPKTPVGLGTAFAVSGGGSVEMLPTDLLVSADGNVSHAAWQRQYKMLDGTGQVRLQAGWATRVESAAAHDILILNSGLHFSWRNNLRQTKFEYHDVLRRVFGWLSSHFAGRIVYRDTYMGVQRCHGYVPGRLTAPARSCCDYGDAEELNGLVREVVDELGLRDRVWFLRVGPMSQERCDRRDAVHFCVPGPVNEWVRALYNWLILTGWRRHIERANGTGRRGTYSSVRL